MYDAVITLLKHSKQTDEYGDVEETISERTVFAEIRSVKSNEFYQAQASGFKPAIKFVLADYCDYQNEEMLRFDGKEYEVIRTYRTGVELEIICERGVDI